MGRVTRVIAHDGSWDCFGGGIVDFAKEYGCVAVGIKDCVSLIGHITGFHVKEENVFKFASAQFLTVCPTEYVRMVTGGSAWRPVILPHSSRCSAWPAMGVEELVGKTVPGAFSSFGTSLQAELMSL